LKRILSPVMNDVPAPPESVTTRAADRWRSYWSLAAIVVIAFLWLYRSPWLASDLPVAPDSVEYALAPAHLLETGRYAIVIEGREIPPRYPPWFSSAVILPVYAVLGTDPGNAILPVTALAVAGIALAWLIGRRISSHAGAVLASIAVLALPTYANWSKHVMSDVPCVTLMLGAWLLYLRLRASSGAQVRGFFVAGVLVAMGALFRPVFAAMVLPFLWAALGPWRAMFLRLGALGVPLVVGATASLAYNVATFGSVSRNGYNLWVPVPNDYPHLLFSLAHVPLNLRVIAATSLPLVVAVVAVLAVVLWFVRRPAAAEERRALGESIIFLALTTTPIVIFHLVYFFPSDRFFLPLMAGMAIIAGALAGRLLGAERERVLQAPGAGAAGTCHLFLRHDRRAAPAPAAGRRTDQREHA
jgi:4-amino-4-deoxy-L-arabinose transferase-like glycosyltransferase